ncbi:MAG: NAD(P) transhydrogenase subunit alpha [Clostridiales bacterium]|jgi:NAD(P) transhydrogenase subunit alpha|nr:NAD(P) transhydrogenase subunit alpha [Clostridiales bacterium]
MKRVFLCKETAVGETRAALVPSDVKALDAMGYEIAVQSGAGLSIGHADDEYAAAGAKIAGTPQEGYQSADIVVRINKPEGPKGLAAGMLHISSFDVFNEKEAIGEFAAAGIGLVSLEMIPRTTLAQKMDIQSSQMSLAGYYAVLLAAARLPKILPMMTTPSGTISPAKIFIIGVGVAGLQAIATAKRLGARVEAFDTRPEVEEQVKSLGAKFIKIDLGQTGSTEQGYAKELTPEQIEIQRQAQAKICAGSDIVITTAKVFGRKAPLLLTKDMTAQMKPGSVIIDMAVKTGGNVEGSSPDGDVVLDNGVTIIGGDGLERFVPKDASDMFSGNIRAFLEHFWDDESKAFKIDFEDDIMRGCLITYGGKVVHGRCLKSVAG